MRVGTLALAAAVMLGAAASSASALPLGAASGVKSTSDGVVLAAKKVVVVKKPAKKVVVVKQPVKKVVVVKKPVVVHKFKYRPGSRLKHAPSNWHRYDKRPGDWNTRGCVIVGPIWWCP